MKSTLIIDSNALAYTAFYTVGELSLDEVKTGVVFGFLRNVLSLARRFDTNDIIFCWDSQKSRRRIIYPEYKKKRHKDKDPLEIKKLKEAFKQFNVLRSDILPRLGFNNVFRFTGYESDDIIAIICKEYPELTHVIATTDSDLYQLMENRGESSTLIFNLKTKKNYYPEMFEKDYKITCDKWAEVKAIAGCSTDEVKGIEGVGEKTAIKYLNGELNKGKILSRILDGEDIIERNRKLVKLPFNDGKGINVNLYENEFIKEKFIEVFDEWQFKSFLKKDNFYWWIKNFNL